MKITWGNFAKVSQNVEAALTNEQVTRRRVELLEDGLRLVADVVGRSFLGRLKWLLLGK